MYIANKTFTSKHHHDYTKGQRITNARYFFLSLEDKSNFDYHIHGSYSNDEENDPNFGHGTGEYYYPASDVSTHAPVTIIDEPTVDPLATITAVAIIEELMDNSPSPDATPSFDPSPDPTPSFDSTPAQDFGGGTSDGGGAGGSWGDNN